MFDKAENKGPAVVIDIVNIQIRVMRDRVDGIEAPKLSKVNKRVLFVEFNRLVVVVYNVQIHLPCVRTRSYE